jgi:hypothetical protein
LTIPARGCKVEGQGRLVEYTIQFYKLLRKKAKTDRATGEVVFEGKVSSLYDELGISRAYYSKMMEVLQEIGGIEYLVRGTRHYKTRIRIHDEPTIEQIEAYRDLTRKPSSGKVTSRSLDNRVTQLERRLGSLDVPSAIANLESRLKALEG